MEHLNKETITFFSYIRITAFYIICQIVGTESCQHKACTIERKIGFTKCLHIVLLHVTNPIRLQNVLIWCSFNSNMGLKILKGCKMPSHGCTCNCKSLQDNNTEGRSVKQGNMISTNSRSIQVNEHILVMHAC